jgi:SagB-type dehydrogenase family enzyme
MTGEEGPKTMKGYFVLILLLGMVIVATFAVWQAKRKTMKTKDTPGYSKVIVRLPQPRFDTGTSVEKALLSRRSVREFREEPLTLAEIGQLLWAAQGVTSPGGLRTAPSAGALYPLETYIVAGNVTGLAAGVYRYLPHQHALALIIPGDRRGEVSDAALYQASIRKAPVSLVFSAVFARSTGKYGKRGLLYVYMEQGHAAENVFLQAVSLNLGTVVIGAFDDAGVKKVLSLPPEEEPLSIMPVGGLIAKIQ